jgi:hypothetical protein
MKRALLLLTLVLVAQPQSADLTLSTAVLQVALSVQILLEGVGSVGERPV